MSNPFFEPSTLPYQLPPFADIREEHYLPAFEAGMAEKLAEIDAIAADTEGPTFANTVVALERSGAVLTRVANVFFNISSSDATPGTDAIEGEMSPKLAALSDAMLLNQQLFARIRALYEQRENLELSAEESRLLERYYTRFVRAGAALSESERDRLRAWNMEIASATTEFKHNIMAATKAATLILETEDELAGLAPAAVAAAAENARSLGQDGWALSLQNVSNQPVLAELADREVRRRMMMASLGRGFGGSPNAELAGRIANLRAKRADLLGYPDHAAYTVADQTAKTTDAVEDMLAQLIAPAVTNAEREAAELTAAMRAGDPGADTELRSWDWQYWSEKVRAERFALDADALRPYLELERVLRDGVFHAAELVYGITFQERTDLVGYHPEVRVFEVFDTDGSGLGLFLGDFFARPSKRGGAWMNELVGQSGLDGTRAVVVNNLNIVKPPQGEPALLTWDNVRTLFHEFGHALHGLFSDVRYPFFSGTSVPRDFVEFPSQVNEMWASRPEILENYAKHVETGAPIPAELLEKRAAAERFGEGFRTVEYLGATLLDWAWHRITADQSADIDAELFEESALRKAGLALSAIPPRYRTGYFAHIFAGGYGAGYYSYIWSEVLDADTVEWFEDGAAPIREKGEQFRRGLLAKGGSVDPLAAYESFRGRAPEIQPLLNRRGLTG
ncbi:M3 family metallopeptidase [Nocardia sp. NBC_01503]|uniref:M3 family metallopeptidase n=1 Tax=Nocardia sp. NBC_01503 TaxID=2975997 RepID=UPI002E7B66D5|nr:M3 family metallopeptidase [Nocardia sp. NBC_01503]WTL31200.1 M3 family metallopeptidase [Nocardia sp. NBC_01503]